MAVTQLSNVIVPEVFEQYVAEDTCISTALLQSGVVVQSDYLQTQLPMGGNIILVPSWLDLVSPSNANTDPNISSDNPAALATPIGITAMNFVSRKSYLNNVWGQAFSNVHSFA